MKYSSIVFIMMSVIWGACNDNLSKTNLNELSFLKDINDSIKKYPTNPGFYLGRASRLVKNDYKQEALADIEQSFKLLPSGTAAFQKFNILLSQNKLQESIEWLNNCVKLLSPSLYLNMALCDAYLQNKDTLNAQKIINNILLLADLSKDAFDIHQTGELLLCVKDTNAALQYARKSYSIQPLNNEAVFLIAYILSIKKDKNILLFSDTLLKNCDKKVFHKIYFFNARYYQNIGQYKNAIVWYDKAIAQSWSFLEAYMHKADCQKKMNLYKDALQTLSVASHIQTPNDELMFEVADCYHHLNDSANAIEYYQNSLKNNTLNKDTVLQRMNQLKH